MSVSASRAVSAMTDSAWAARSGDLAAIAEPPSAWRTMTAREWATMSCMSRAMRWRSPVAACSAASAVSSTMRRRQSKWNRPTVQVPATAATRASNASSNVSHPAGSAPKPVAVLAVHSNAPATPIPRASRLWRRGRCAATV